MLQKIGKTVAFRFFILVERYYSNLRKGFYRILHSYLRPQRPTFW